MTAHAYVVLIEDREDGADALLYPSEATALRVAKDYAEAYCTRPEGLKVLSVLDTLYHAEYTPRGSCVTVTKQYFESD